MYGLVEWLSSWQTSGVWYQIHYANLNKSITDLRLEWLSDDPYIVEFFFGKEYIVEFWLKIFRLLVFKAILLISFLPSLFQKTH